MPSFQSLSLIFVSLFGFLAGCDRLSNTNIDLQLECGVDASHEKTFVKVELPSSEPFQAVWLDEGKPREALLSSKNCIEIPVDAGSHLQLLIRSLSTLNGRVLFLTEELRGAQLTRIDFEANVQLSSELVQVTCVADATAANRNLPLKRLGQTRSRLVYNLNRFQLTDTDGKVAWKGDIGTDAESLDLPSTLPEGNYNLTLNSRDAFDLQNPSREAQCKVLLDRSAPSVKILGNDFFVSPGQRLEFEIKDAQNATLYGCMRERRDEVPTQTCDAEGFKPMGPLSAPEKGMWDIYYFAEDSLGHRSSVNLATIAVFHDDQVKQIRFLTQLSAAQETIGKQFAAFSALQEAASIVKGLLLKAERLAVKWDLLKGLSDLNTRLTVRYQQVYSSWDKLAGENLQKTVSDPGSNVWVMLTNKGRAAIFIDKNQMTEFESAKNAVFGRDGSLYILGDYEIRKYSHLQLGQTPTFEVMLTVSPIYDHLEISESGQLLVASGNESILVYKVVEKSPKVYKLSIDILDRVETPSLFRARISADEKFIYYNLSQRIFGIDVIKAEQQELFRQPNYCEIRAMELQADRLYVANTFQPLLFQQTRPPVCGFAVIPILLNGKLGAAEHPLYDGSSQDVESLTLDASRNLLFLAQNESVSASVTQVRLFIADLRNRNLQFAPILLQSSGQDSFLSFELQSLNESRILIHTKNALHIVDWLEGGILVSRPTVSDPMNCHALASRELILCGDRQSSSVSFHVSRDSDRLQPRIVLNPFRSDFFAVSSRTGMKFFNDNFKSELGFYNIDGKALWSLPLTGKAKVGDLSPMARYAVMVTAEKSLSLYDRKGLVAQKTLDLPQNIDAVSVTDSGTVFLLVSQGNDRRLLTYQQHSGAGLVESQSAAWSSDSQPNRILVNPTNEFLIVYSEVLQSWRPLHQNIAIFDSEGRLKKRVDADNSRISFNADDRSWFRILGNEVFRYELESDEEIKIADNLPYAPNEVIEGETPIAKVGEIIYNLATGKKLVPDGVVGLIEGNLLVWMNTSAGLLRIYSADGSKVLLEQEPQPDERMTPIFMFSDGKSPTFHTRCLDQNYLALTDTYTLDLEIALRWISLWN